MDNVEGGPNDCVLPQIPNSVVNLKCIRHDI